MSDSKFKYFIALLVWCVILVAIGAFGGPDGAEASLNGFGFSAFIIICYGFFKLLTFD